MESSSPTLYIPFTALLVTKVTIGLTEFTVIETTSVSVCTPPEPEKPWSLDVMERLARPLNPAIGLKIKPSRAVLISTIVPTKTIVPSFTPEPWVKVSPPVPDNDINPLAAVSVICISFDPASTSLTLNRFPFPLEKTKAAS